MLISDYLSYDITICILFWFDPFWRPRAEVKKYFRSISGSNENFKICFRNYLTFSWILKYVCTASFWPNSIANGNFWLHFSKWGRAIINQPTWSLQMIICRCKFNLTGILQCRWNLEMGRGLHGRALQYLCMN